MSGYFILFNALVVMHERFGNKPRSTSTCLYRRIQRIRHVSLLGILVAGCWAFPAAAEITSNSTCILIPGRVPLRQIAWLAVPLSAEQLGGGASAFGRLPSVASLYFSRGYRLLLEGPALEPIIDTSWGRLFTRSDQVIVPAPDFSNAAVIERGGACPGFALPPTLRNLTMAGHHLVGVKGIGRPHERLIAVWRRASSEASVIVRVTVDGTQVLQEPLATVPPSIEAFSLLPSPEGGSVSIVIAGRKAGDAAIYLFELFLMCRIRVHSRPPVRARFA